MKILVSQAEQHAAAEYYYCLGKERAAKNLAKCNNTELPELLLCRDVAVLD